MAKVFHSLITSIDIGTTKISVLIAQKMSDDSVVILGIGKAPSYGLEKGVVVDIEKTVQSIKLAIQEAELMAGCSITKAYIGISGNHIQSFNTHGAVPIKNTQVQHSDIEAVLAAAKAVAVEEGQQILHALPQYFIIDGKERVTNPLRLHGVRLEAEVHVIMGSVASMQNLITCCELAGVMVKDIILEQLASAMGVLNQDEMILGVGVLDIGGGTSDFAVYQEGTIRYTKVLPIAGNHFTKDLAVGLQATIQDAERIKKESGSVIVDVQKTEQKVEIESVRGSVIHTVNQYTIDYILYMRAVELLRMVQNDIKTYNLSPILTSGLVITGGGSLLKGIDMLAEQVLSIPVRLGSVRVHSDAFASLHNPTYATGYGLLLYALKQKQQLRFEHMEGPIGRKIFMKMKTWIETFF